MDIKRVSSSQVSFSGPLGKTLIRYVNLAKKEELQRITQIADAEGRSVSHEELKNIYELAQEVYNNLKQSAAGLDRRTVLDINGGFLNLKNPLSKDFQLTINNAGKEVSPKIDETGRNLLINSEDKLFFDFRQTGRQNLEKLNLVAKELAKVAPKDIDMTFAQSAAKTMQDSMQVYRSLDFIDRFKMLYQAHKIDRFAKKFGHKYAINTEVMNYFKTLASYEQNSNNNKIILKTFAFKKIINNLINKIFGN